MSSSISRRVSRALSISSRSSRDSGYSSLHSIRPDTTSLLNPEFPSPLCPSRMEIMMEFETGNAILEPENRAWGSPPAFQWPAFIGNKTGRCLNVLVAPCNLVHSITSTL